MKTVIASALFTLVGVALQGRAVAAPGVPTNGLVSFGNLYAQTNGRSSASDLSADGRFVVYSSLATNIGAGDANGDVDVFRYDRFFGITLCMSVASGGGSTGNGLSTTANSQSRLISANGRFVLFTSTASNLAAGDTNGALDGYLRDTDGFGSTQRVTLGAGGSQIAGASIALAMSGDATKILFSTPVSLVGSDTNALDDLYVYDRSTLTIKLVTVDNAGNALGGVQLGAMADNGRAIVFSTGAALSVADTNAASDVYYRDIVLNQTALVSTGAGSIVGNATSYQPTISGDGVSVGFRSQATNLVAGDTNGAEDVFVKNLGTNAITRVSTKTGGAQVVNPGCTSLDLSSNGSVIALECTAPDMVSGDTNNAVDVFTKVLGTGVTTRVSQTSAGGQGATGSALGRISDDGTQVSIYSFDAFVTGDTNGQADVYGGVASLMPLALALRDIA